ncbi:MAG: LacI family DNA-binding transcriptional regulator [Fusicatenibacter saccharivorans]
MNISAKELAKLINVSPATVSMVFNNKPGISDATREAGFKNRSRVWLCAEKK